MASPLKYFKPMQLLRQGWNEIPDIVAGTALAIGSVIGTFAIYQYKDAKGRFDHKRYRLEYTVVRPDDPLAAQSPQRFDYDAAFGKK
ncbi:uncharacterized protein LOC129004082 [Macrosteles quadrilineatus]|uniref:uncharacterized protein LOC129004082 n=1 Tax=Macrosteles quadrilineatus TaxID=74068 RepID=UPI0023E33308|nr:uncharacterized protein LOC129004082 [Macrosteles quadrilineatus]